MNESVTHDNIVVAIIDVSERFEMKRRPLDRTGLQSNVDTFHGRIQGLIFRAILFRVVPLVISSKTEFNWGYMIFVSCILRNIIVHKNYIGDYALIQTLLINSFHRNNIYHYGYSTRDTWHISLGSIKNSEATVITPTKTTFCIWNKEMK